MPVTVTVDDIDMVGHYKKTRLKFVRDSGAAMSVAHVHTEPAAKAVLQKIDGTLVNLQNETPSGLTYSVSGELTSILIEDALLPVSETVFMDLYVGPTIDQ